MEKERTENPSSSEQEMPNLEKIAAEFAERMAKLRIKQLEKEQGPLNESDYFFEYDYAFYFAYTAKLDDLRQQQGLRQEIEPLDPRVVSIQQERFRKEFIEKARPYLKQILNPDELDRTLELLNKEFLVVSQERDYVRRSMAAIENFYVQISSWPKRKEINHIIAGIAMEYLAKVIEKSVGYLLEMNKGGNPEEMLPFKKK